MRVALYIACLCLTVFHLNAEAGDDVCADPYAAIQKSAKITGFPENSFDAKGVLADAESDIGRAFVADPKLYQKAIMALDLKKQCKNQLPCRLAVQRFSMIMAGRMLYKLGGFDISQIQFAFKDSGTKYDYAEGMNVIDELGTNFTLKNMSPDDFILKYSNQRDFYSALKRTGETSIPKMSEIVKMQIKKFLENQPIDEAARRTIESRIDKISFHLCGGLAVENATYFSDTNAICVGVGMINDGAIASTLAHEIAHSFDPCNWQTIEKDRPYPFQSMLSCLRSSSSVSASVQNDPSFAGKCSTKDNVVNDQIGESFSDWVGSEVLLDCERELGTPTEKLGDAVTKNVQWMVSNTVSAIAQESTWDVHPKLSDRFNKIYFANPQIRSAFGCKPAALLKHCGLTSTSSSAKTTGQKSAN